MREGGRLKDIERISNVKFEKIMIPSAQEVRDKKLLAFTDTIINTEMNQFVEANIKLLSLETSVFEASSSELFAQLKDVFNKNNKDNKNNHLKASHNRIYGGKTQKQQQQ
jgi:hypothetical protein